MEQGKAKLIGTLAIAVAMIVAVVIGGRALVHRNDGPKTLSVKGGAEQDFVSDLVVWNVTIQSHSSTPLEGLKDVERQQKILASFLSARKVQESEVVFGPVSYREDVTGYYDPKQERYIEIKNGFVVQQTATVTSQRVDEIENVVREVCYLIAQDVTATSEDPRYYYTKLADLKLEMVAAASEDARLRAEQIASESKAHLGGLRKASLGTFQIIGKHSNEDYSWGGNFNTSSKEKTVSITVTAEYLVK
ncbi:SIMPL domain-containing protein [uncultured Porphyromonas sp.]|uniref:SIMPL domain-containing protein n=1 Tax=uncultured Porphyromonas sp. TaxID=159274 RepID=UPI00262989C3|nr:SIMPL domain-containing protein [uncultured Porphyromonas sp.]